ncbi:DUF4145 domain-containing protein [Rhizobium laguerreae]|uniref:DUF4145 domain-containing protein n=1 Tax=Rhizobium laguerreae TaxID=1076926 RepID=UPI001E5535AE|nr:DUF4145 domain-containing protein [Rhizobium laguerreae]UFW65647.1 DUF4145 domain-containing protein [Rhizobium laguerreae]
MSPKKDSFHQVEPKYITTELEESGEIGEASYGRFHGFLVCSMVLCGEIVAVAGDYSDYYHRQYDDQTEEMVEFTDRNYRTFLMRPAPPIISMPKSLNADSRKHLERAFELFWADWASCANRLRIVTEYLLDQLAIPRIAAKGKRYLDLAARIELLKAARPGHDNLLNALRVVGNLGSHDGEVDFEVLLDCFEFLEEAMVELLDRRREKMDARAALLIQSRGKPALD